MKMDTSEEIRSRQDTLHIMRSIAPCARAIRTSSAFVVDRHCMPYDMSDMTVEKNNSVYVSTGRLSLGCMVFIFIKRAPAAFAYVVVGE